MRLTITIVLILISLNAVSQNLIGNWQVVSVDTNDFTYIVQKDSISLKEDLQEIYSNQIHKNAFLKMVIAMYSDTKFIFTSNTYTQISELGTISENYTIVDHNKILLESESLPNSNLESLMYFKLEGSLLYLNFPLEESEIRFVLKKTGT